MDGDNDIDIITGASMFQGGISCWENNGYQQFTKHFLTIDYTRVHGLSVIDMDDDGDIDICSASADSDTIDWFENIGDLEFIRHVVASDYGGSNDVFSIDMDSLSAI